MSISNKERLLRSTVLAGVAALTMGGAPVFAQEADEPVQTAEEGEAAPAPASSDRIVVTGSRIARDEFTSASPIQVIDGEIARDLGLVDAADLLAQTTVVTGQQITTGLSTSGGILSDNGPGSATANLRGQGAGRTLVLVNGRRLAPAGVRGAPSAPDLNLIPGSLIDRVEVLVDGASSVYGSDAVAGVVNYILKTDFDGLTLDAFITDPEMSGDGGRQQVYSGTLGVTSDRGFIGFAAEYSETDGYTNRQLGSFWEPFAGNCISSYVTGASGQRYETCAGSFGAGSGNITGIGYVGYEPGRTEAGLPDGFFRIPITSDLLTPGSANGQALLIWPEELDAVRAPDFERLTLYTTGEYELGGYGNITAYFEGSFSERDTTTRTSGQGRVRVPDTYALNPFGRNATMYYSSQIENDTVVSQTRLIGGLRGELPFLNGLGSLNNWTWDAYISHSRSSGYDRVEGVYHYPRFEQTIANTEIVGGEAVCTPRGVPNEGQQVTCRPLDFFNETFLTTGRFADEADNDYFFPNRITNTAVEQNIYTGYVAGDLINLPAGPLSMVLGYEYREDSITTDTDPLAASGDFFGYFGDPGSNGHRNLMEAFFETEIPVLAGLDYAEELSFNVAARWTEESEFGAHITYRVQGLYAPNDWLRFRSTYGTSFRAPNLNEQFGGRVQGFGDPNDPCRVPGTALPLIDHDNDPSTPDQRQYDPSLDTREASVIQNCINGGGPFNLPGTDPFTLGTTGLGTPAVTFLGSPTQVASGSNPNLEAETSTAFTGGFVLEQPWFDRFDLRLTSTYFNIEVDGEVDQLSAATIVSRCYNDVNLADPQCGFLTRSATTGEITFVEALNQNLGKQTSEGVDLNIEFGLDFNVPWFDSGLRYDAIFRGTQMLEQTEEEYLADGVEIDDDLTEYGNPEYRASLTHVLGFKDWRVLWQTRYISEFIEDTSDPEDPTTSSLNPCIQAGDGPCIVLEDSPEYFVHDMSVSYLYDTWAFRAGVNNVFDEAPFSQTNVDSVRGTGYDLTGRTFFVNVSKQF